MKIWNYIASFFIGFATMAIITLKWFNGDDYSIEIKKLKNKKSSGDISVPVNVESPETSRKQRRLDKKKNK